MMAKALEENGAKVYIIGRRQEGLEKAAKQAVCSSLNDQSKNQTEMFTEIRQHYTHARRCDRKNRP